MFRRYVKYLPNHVKVVQIDSGSDNVSQAALGKLIVPPKKQQIHSHTFDYYYNENGSFLFDIFWCGRLERHLTVNQAHVGPSPTARAYKF